MFDSIKPGDQFKCRRRGHVVDVMAVKSVTPSGSDKPIVSVFYKNRRGALVQMSAVRLFKPYRFEQIVAQAKIPA